MYQLSSSHGEGRGWREWRRLQEMESKLNSRTMMHSIINSLMLARHWGWMYSLDGRDSACKVLPPPQLLLEPTFRANNGTLGHPSLTHTQKWDVVTWQHHFKVNRCYKKALHKETVGVSVRCCSFLARQAHSDAVTASPFEWRWALT